MLESKRQEQQQEQKHQQDSKDSEASKGSATASTAKCPVPDPILNVVTRQQQLQYRGFIDRGARLEARFSKRMIQVRGSVMFQMRDGAVAVDSYRDILPIDDRQGTTKFFYDQTKPKKK